jgi:hypothetical protein
MKREFAGFSITALLLFLIMTFSVPAVAGGKVDTAWILLCAGGSLAFAAVSEWLFKKTEKKPISYIIISHFIAWINKRNKGE